MPIISGMSKSAASTDKPLVGIIMGSKSDWEVMKKASDVLMEFGIAHESRAISAHRSPDLVADYAKSAEERGLEVIIAAAGMAAALPGVAAAMTLLPVLGVPMEGKLMGGLDALLVDGPNAGRRPGRHAGRRFGRGQKRRPAGRANPGQFPPGVARKAPPVLLAAGRTDRAGLRAEVAAICDSSPACRRRRGPLYWRVFANLAHGSLGLGRPFVGATA